MPTAYEQTFTVCQFECDPWNRMTPGSALRRIQEIATVQCEELGLNNDIYERTHTVFLLSRLSLEIHSMPMVGQTVRMVTKAYGMRRAVFHRVTSLYGLDGKLLCEADTRWVLVDTNTMHILRKAPEEIEAFFLVVPELEEHSMKMPKPGPLTSYGEIRAAYSLCDCNKHINNTQYADMLCNYLPLEKMEAALPKKMLLFYRNEIPLGHSFTLYGSKLDTNSFYFSADEDGNRNLEGYVEF